MKCICIFKWFKNFFSLNIKKIITAACVIILMTFMGAGLYINRIISDIPDNICVPCNEETVVNLKIPASGSFTGSCYYSELDLSRPVTIMADKTGNYNMQLKLFGLVNVADMNINVVDETYVYAGGFQVGFYMRAEGVLVVDCQNVRDINGKSVSPCEGLLEKGDIITAVDDKQILNKQEFNEYIEASGCKNIKITFERDGQIRNVNIKPVECANNTAMIGLWVKDDAQGIGTVTYVNSDGYAALGHGVNDVNTEKFLKISNGEIYITKIMSVVKGKDGKPGEYIGTIDYSEDNKLGNVIRNESTGIYGEITPSVINDYNLELIQIAHNTQVKTKEASIRLYEDGHYTDYKIKINKLLYDGERNISFQVTDERLLEKTNGIVQGM